MIFRFVLLNAANITGFAVKLVLYLNYRTALFMKCTFLLIPGSGIETFFVMVRT